MSLPENEVPGVRLQKLDRLSSSLRLRCFDISISMVIRLVALMAFTAITVSAIAGELNPRANLKSRIEMSDGNSDAK